MRDSSERRFEERGRLSEVAGPDAVMVLRSPFTWRRRCTGIRNRNCAIKRLSELQLMVSGAAFLRWGF